MTNNNDINSTLQNVARQLGLSAQSDLNAHPEATASSSPVSYAINSLSTAATTIMVANPDRHGLIFHNPGTANAYIFPTVVYAFPALTTTTPTSAVLGGAFLVAAGSSVMFPSSNFSNVNCGWSAFSATGSSQPFTVVEFY